METPEDNRFGFNIDSIVIGLLRMMKNKGLLEEEEVLDLLWEAKDPHFPWSKQDIKDLLKL